MLPRNRLIHTTVTRINTQRTWKLHNNNATIRTAITRPTLCYSNYYHSYSLFAAHQSKPLPPSTTTTRRYSAATTATPTATTLYGSEQQQGPEHQDSDQITTPLQRYEAIIKRGILRPDPIQRRAAMRLNDLFERILVYEEQLEKKKKTETEVGASPGSRGLFSKWFGGLTSKSDNEIKAPKGIYMFGGVGCGKTFLLDLMYHSFPKRIKNTRRVHFHAFMLEVHYRIQQAKNKGLEGNPIPYVARQIADEALILFFDEFQVTDIADAMILKQLFETMISLGVVIIATSNRAPDDLYKGGIQRASFLPFIPFLKENCEIFHFVDENMAPPQDYRVLLSETKDLQNSINTYFSPVNSKTYAEMRKIFERESKWEIVSKTAPVMFGRTLTIKECSPNGCAFMTFDELCRAPLGAVDYLALADNFHTIFIHGVPYLSMQQRNEARRFIILIDILYDHQLRVFVSCEAPSPAEIFNESTPSTPGGLHSWEHELRDLFTANGDADNLTEKEMKRLQESQQYDNTNTENEAFAFGRTISRLFEMQSAIYIGRSKAMFNVRTIR